MPLRPRHSARIRRTGFWRHWTLWIVFFTLALLPILGGVALWKSGRWLVASDPFEKAAWAVIMAGESRDVERSDAALDLYLDGRLDTLIYSSNRVFKTRWASEFMAEYLAREGYPREKIFEFRQDAQSTLEEARLLIRQFRWQNLDTVLIITSNYHTARTRRIFRELAQGYPHFIIHPADYAEFDPAAWWSSREGRKTWFLEWMKTIATHFELLRTSPEIGKAESNGLVGIHDAPVAFIPPLIPLPDTVGRDTLPDSLFSDTGAVHGDLAGSLDSGHVLDSAAVPDTASNGDTRKASKKDSLPAVKEAGSASKPAESKRAAQAKKPAAKPATKKSEKAKAKGKAKKKTR